MGGRLSSFQIFSCQFIIIKRLFSIVLYKIDLLVLRFNFFFTKIKTQFIKLNYFLKNSNVHINHLGQISLINMTLKWHYINMCDKIDGF